MEKLFLSDPVLGKTYTYSDLIRDLNELEWLQPKYLKADDIYRVFVTFLRSVLSDGHLVLLDRNFSEEEIKQLVPNDEERVSSQHYGLAEPVADYADLIQRLNQGQGARIGFFTSGTTGLPKRVDHHLSTLARSVKHSAKHADAVWALAYNPTHIAGCQVFLQAALNGSSIVNVFGLGRQDVFRAMDMHEVTHISATPTFYRMLMPVDCELPRVQRVTFGGERMDVRLERKLKMLFPSARFLNVYASTEAGTILAADGEEFSIKAGLEDVVRVLEGQLMLHRSLLGEFVGAVEEGQDDWYATGDLVEITSSEPLRFKILRRDNQMINVGGYKVNPEEVEAALREIYGIEDARVYARPNSVLGSIVCCDVVVSFEMLEKVIRRSLAERLQSFKIPRTINFVDSLEKTRSGKVKRLL